VHTIRPNPQDVNEWQVIFVTSESVTTVVTCPNQETAMMYASFLNGGLNPHGYNLDVTNHY
jgi:hypothetical protein